MLPLHFKGTWSYLGKAQCGNTMRRDSVSPCLPLPCVTIYRCYNGYWLNNTREERLSTEIDPEVLFSLVGNIIKKNIIYRPKERQLIFLIEF